MPQNPQPSVEELPPDGTGFLATIQQDPRLLEKLLEIDDSNQTITIDASGKLSVVTDPSRTDAPRGNTQETIAAAGLATVAAPFAAPPHLPLRQVVFQGQRSADATDYRLLGALGSGGTAVVYQAHQRAVDREVAVKVLRDDLAADPLAQQRFLAEAQTVGGLDHPNVIALHELARTDEGQLFYSMKRIDGTSWAEVLEDRSLDENLSTLLRVADAIRYAHSRGLLHRDIKPENVMLGRFGEVLLADWGLALPYATSPEQDTSQSIGGTPAYMAPEQASGNLSDLGPHTDIYMLGAVLFQILTGVPPHHGETLIACIRAAAHNHIRPTRVTGALMDIAMHAMQTNPAQRHASVDAFQAAIRTFLEHQESVRLVQRARQYSSEAAQSGGYDKYGLAISLLNEALEVWPDNHRAAELLTSLRTDFARRAISQGDYDLALNLLDSAGEGDSELANRVRHRRKSRQRRIEREARLQMLFSHSPDAVLLTRLDDGTILEANEVFLHRFGFDLESIIGKSVPDLKLWVYPHRRTAFLEELRSRDRIDNYEAQFRSSNGSPVDVLISGRTLILDDQKLLVTNIRDVTQRKLAEDALKRSRQRLREFTRLAQLGTWEFDVASEQVHWNSELYALTGIERGEQAPSLSMFLETVHPDDRKSLLHHMRLAMQNGKAFEVQARHRLPGGGYRTVISRGQPIRDEAGQVVEIYGTIHDITQQAAEVERIQTQTTAMQQLIDWSPEPTCAIAADGSVLAASSALGQSIGVPAAELRCGWSLEIDPQSAGATTENGTQSVAARLRHVDQDPQSWQRFSLHATDSDRVRIAKLLRPTSAP